MAICHNKPNNPRAFDPRPATALDVFDLVDSLAAALESDLEPGRLFREGNPLSGTVVLESDSVESFSRRYLLSSILSKYNPGGENPGREEETWRRFYVAEEECRLANLRLKKLNAGFVNRASVVEQVFRSARCKISYLVGRLDWNYVSDHFGWGPGASTRIPKRDSDASNKYMGNPHCSYSNFVLAMAAIADVPLWKQSLETSSLDPNCAENIPLIQTDGNKVVSVPKNYKTDRTIGIEPDMNMYVQKGLGALIRQRLKKRAKIDLNDQSVNQRLACLGSETGSLATVDLSMASDCVGYELVRYMMPPEWFNALEQCRTTMGRLPSGKILFYQKFSSMGNGFTFELESLIFYALTWACCNHLGLKEASISVYGDDIICPTEAVPLLFEVLEYAGFKPNQEKSFWSGPFRESCGKHYFQGKDVTPFYIRKPLDHYAEILLLHNNLYRWCSRNSEFSDVDWVSLVLDRISGSLPSVLTAARIPDGIGDGALIGTWDESPLQPMDAPRNLRKSKWWEGYKVRVLRKDPLPPYRVVKRNIKGKSVVVKRYRSFTGVGRLLASLALLEQAPLPTWDLAGLKKNSYERPLMQDPVKGERYVLGKQLVQQNSTRSPWRYLYATN